MKWNVILKDTKTGKFQPYNIFEYRDFRLSIENLFKKQYPEERFLKELDLEIHYFFWAKIEWEIFITAWPPYISKNEININAPNAVERPPATEAVTHFEIANFFRPLRMIIGLK